MQSSMHQPEYVHVKRRKPNNKWFLLAVATPLAASAFTPYFTWVLTFALLSSAIFAGMLLWRKLPREGVVRRELAFKEDAVAVWRRGKWRAYSILQVTMVPDVVRGDVKRFFRMLYLEKIPFFYHVVQGPASGRIVEEGERGALKASGAWKTTILFGVWGEGGSLEGAVEEAKRRAEKAKGFFEASFPHHRVEVLRGDWLVDAVKELFL